MTEEKRYFDRWEPLIAASLVKELEGLRLEAYLCPAGVPTIGYGHTRGVKLGTRISAEQADQLLTVDLERVRLQLMQSVKVPVSEGQFKALLSFAYNFGAAAVKDSTLLKYVNAGKFGCSTVQVAEPMPSIPETLLVPELPLAKSWSSDFLSLLRSAETDGNAVPQSTTHSLQ